MFASRLNPNVRFVHNVLFDHDFCTAIDVNTVRSELPVVVRIFGGGNVVDQVPGNGSVAGSVNVAIGRGLLVSNRVNPMLSLSCTTLFVIAKYCTLPFTVILSLDPVLSP